ncbi:hypothetical protein LEP1GSC047_1077 [Leptospira inadai serovar Lyme str. 10]|uniref:Uncharacterized protein n=2 Tax=Leptospira inadai serovar Lyme TaxID=293084 RepID=V6HH52_9LEPT|nr:hypothetical protein [Leptospira inadai]EQA35445.1 hypothetical protein LEP1GSC047_1077 [Leptospira inadai serovar Lyme str. 10]PNV71922.1 hypothetical protein BES34_020370 [Leptospira inadai serovar Lyme]
MHHLSLEPARIGIFPFLLIFAFFLSVESRAQTTPAGTQVHPKESLTGGPPVLKKLVEDVRATLKERGYTLDKKSQFTGSVFKGSSVIFKLQFPEGKDRKVIRKLGIGLAHEIPDEAVMVQIFISDSQDRKLSPLYTGLAETSFIYEWEARYGENHFLIEIRLEESESNVANFELLFGSELYTPSAAFGREEKDQNLNLPQSPGTKQPDTEGRAPGTTEVRNYFEVFKKEF